MTLAYDLFWSFRSPYSYLITHRLVALERDFDVKGEMWDPLESTCRHASLSIL